MLSPAKINLMLHINGKRDDGYHELQTVYELLDFCDELSFNINTQGNINLTNLSNTQLNNSVTPQLDCDTYLVTPRLDRGVQNTTLKQCILDPAVKPRDDDVNKPRDDRKVNFPISIGALNVSQTIGNLPIEKNLVYKAAQLLKQTTNTTLGADITLEKNIPAGAGLGGGSSNAATTLLALNKLWKTHLSQQELAQLAVELGADVPVFIYRTPAFAEGIGEKLTPIELPKRWYLLCIPNCFVSTASIFQHPQLIRNTKKITINDFIKHGGQNDCQPLVTKLYPQVKQALETLNQHTKAQLSGTGSTIFAPCDSKQQATYFANQLPNNLTIIITQSFHQHIEMKFINQHHF